MPCLLLQNGGLVKTYKFAKPKYVGDPINAIRIFNDKEVDELIVLDINASKEKKGPNFELIEQFAGECFMPLAYGGGVRSISDARRLFSIGVEKVVVQSAAMDNIGIITDIANTFGRQSVVASIDVRRAWHGGAGLYSSKEHKITNSSWVKYLKDIVEAGAGEVVINSVNRDGTLQGMDYDLIKEACAIVPVPVIAMGGLAGLSDVRRAIAVGASAVAAGAYFVFHGPHRAVLITYPEYAELEKCLEP